MFIYIINSKKEYMVKRICHKCYAEFDRKSSYDKHTNKIFDCSLKNNKATINEEKPLISENFLELTIFCKSDLSEKIMQNLTENLTENLIENLTENITKNLTEVLIDDIQELNLSCLHCNKIYSSKYTLERHINNNCKIKKEKDKLENIHTIKLSEIKQQLNDIMNDNIELKEQIYKICHLP